MASSNPLGDLIIQVGGDITPIESALNEIPAVAASVASEVNAALSSVAGTDQLTASIEAASQALGSDLSASATHAADALRQVAPGAAAAAQATNDATAANQALGAQLQQIIAVLGDMSQSLNSMAASEREIADNSEEAKSSLSQMSETIEGMKQVAEAFIAVALAEKLGELAEKSLEVYGETQRVETSLRLLGGSASAAKDTIEELQQKAVALGIPLEAMEKTAQKLAVAFGTGEGLTEALQAAANASAVTGQSFEAIASALERVQLTGQVSARQLVALGLSWEDLAHTMGASIEDAQATLKKGGQDAAADVEVLLDTIKSKYGEAAAEQSKQILNQFQSLKNDVLLVFESLGGAIAPSVQKIVGFLKDDLLPAIKALIDSFNALPGPLKDFAVFIGAGALALVPLTAGLATLGFALEGLELILGRVGIAMGTEAVAAEAMAVSEGVATAATTELAAAQSTLGGAAGVAGTALKTGLLATLGEIAVYAGPAAMAILVTKDNVDKLKQSWNDFRDTARMPEIFQPESRDQIKAAFADVAAGITVMRNAFSEGAQAIIDKEKELTENLAEAKATLAELTKAYQEGKVSADVVEVATYNVQQAFKALHPEIKDTASELEKLIDGIQKANEQFAGARKIYADVLASFKDGSATVGELSKAYDLVQSKAKGVGQSFADVTAEMVKATGAAANQISHIGELAQVYAKLKASGDTSAATQLAQSEAMKKLESAAAALGLTVKQLGDGFQFELGDKAGKASAGVQSVADALNGMLGPANQTYVLVNGKLVPTLDSLGDGSGKAASEVGGLTVEIDRVTNSATGMDETIRVLKGSTDQTTTSIGDLDSKVIVIHQDMQDAIDTADKMAKMFGAVSEEAYAAATAVNTLADEIRAEDDAASSSKGGGGGGGGGRGGRGGGGIDAATMLSIYAQAGALGSTLDQLAQAMGLVVMGNNQYATPDYVAGLPTLGPTKKSGGGSSSSGSSSTATATSALADLTDAAQLAAKDTGWLGITIVNTADTVKQSFDGVTSSQEALITSAGAAGDALQHLGSGTQAMADAMGSATKAAAAQAAVSLGVMAAEVAIVTPVGSVVPSLSSIGTSQGAPISVGIDVNAGAVVGMGGMAQLAALIQQQVISGLRQASGLKL